MGIPDQLTCLLRNLYAGQEATVRTEHGTMDWFQIGKGVCQGCILSLSLFNFYAEYIMQNAGLDEAQAGIKIARKVKMKVAQLYSTLCNPMDCSPPGSSVHGDFSRQEYWSGLPCPPPGDLPNPGTGPRSPALQVDSLLSEAPGKHTQAEGSLFRSLFVQGLGHSDHSAEGAQNMVL